MSEISASERLATAYHEAGHAVVALALDRPVQRISIVPGQESLGLCHFGKGIIRPSDDWIERECMIALAGVAAEAMLTGNYNWSGGFRDHQYVQSLTRKRAGEKQADRLEKRLLRKTEHLLAEDAHWNAVEQIAAELLKSGIISGRTARHLFDLCRTRS
jgi:ATP-dependent Zn protease